MKMKMNKQELITKMHEAILNCKQLKYYTTQFEKGYNDGVSYAIYLAEQLDEPEKPVVPKFVAEWYEENKDDFDKNLFELIYYVVSCYTIDGEVDFEELTHLYKDWMSNDFKRWMSMAYENGAITTLVNMHQFGYTVEKEKLYTVEIPNPNSKGTNKIYLCKENNTGKVYLCKGNFNPSKNKNLKLTEAEIKQDFEWAWQWAEEVKG